MQFIRMMAIPIVALKYSTFLFVHEGSRFLPFMPVAKAASASTRISRCSSQHSLAAGCSMKRKVCSNHFEGRTSWALPTEHPPAASNCRAEVSGRARAVGLPAKAEFTPGCTLLHRPTVTLETQFLDISPVANLFS